jgi:hypothetical protein
MPTGFVAHRIALVVIVVLCGAGGAMSSDSMPALRRGPITDTDRAFWSFQPVKQVTPPKAAEDSWRRNPIDAFILSSLRERGLAPSQEAERVTLIRRATFDLHGLPPAPAEVDAFVADASPNAYEKLIDRLLASPRYGERWARHWLDVARYAESDGFKQDAYRPGAWHYRDYVIRSFNDDKPYDRFVAEQLAGDEIAPDDPDVVVATGFLRHGTYEYNQRDVPKQWSEILNEITDVTGDALLGLSVGCARCHDHKFDPISQADYYRLQAFFTPLLPRDELLATPADRAAFTSTNAEWERKTAMARAELAVFEAPYVRKASETALAKFPPSMQAILAAPGTGRTPIEQQWAALAQKQVYDPDENPVKVDGKDKAAKERHEVLKKQLAAFDGDRPKPLPRGMIVTDVGPIAPPTCIPGKADAPLEPGAPTVLEGGPLQVPAIQPTATTTGRRTALAKWITDPANPLTARVMVNRVWQAHFGRGLVATSSDFGTLGERPSHPELLDWLAAEFVRPGDGLAQSERASMGWRLKPLHRLIMTSAAYRQASVGATQFDVAMAKDPDNRLLWRMTPRRLDAEQVRDAMLAVTGELENESCGPPADASSPRRSVYLKVVRNKPERLLEAFDSPESFCSVASRNSTTTVTQSLLMMNGAWPLKRATAFADRVRREAKASDASGQIEAAYRLAFARTPSEDERQRSLKFIAQAESEAPAGAGLDVGLVDLCHVLLSSNEFLYVD